MSQFTRRSFLEHTLAVAAAGLAAAQKSQAATEADPPTPPATRPSPNDRVGVAIIGLHGRGKDHLDSYTFDDRVQIVALCDIDQSTFGPAQRSLQSRGRPKATQYADIRKLLEDKSVDVRLDCRAESLAHAGRDLGDAGRQRCYTSRNPSATN